MSSEKPPLPRLHAERSPNPPTLQSWSGWLLGSAAVTVGGVFAGGLGVEVVKSFSTDDLKTLNAVATYFLAAIALLAVGLWWRRRERRRMQVGIAVLAHDSHRGQGGEENFQKACSYFKHNYAVAMHARIDLPTDGPWDHEQVDALADEAMRGVTLARAITPDTAQINLHATMPLNVGFWFGSRFRHDHAPEVALLAAKPSGTFSSFIPVTVLGPAPSSKSPLIVESPTIFDEGDPCYTALALDLQGLGEQFLPLVRETCREYGIHTLLVMRSKTSRLDTSLKTFNGVVEQVCREWRRLKLPDAARAGRHFAFLTGPVPIAIALGARLAAPTRNSWTAFSLRKNDHNYTPMPNHPMS
ncbi:SAVED domain-containing protein [Saccharopolyspora shandongensis]|uniref:SAVED domain-containing protein n=1 Tax=Saccharopolyspora shandongensis TaxID=418495 RepID=UPI0034488696